jgi:hypothetical protein
MDEEGTSSDPEMSDVGLTPILFANPLIFIAFCERFDRCILEPVPSFPTASLIEGKDFRNADFCFNRVIRITRLAP